MIIRFILLIAKRYNSSTLKLTLLSMLMVCSISFLMQIYNIYHTKYLGITYIPFGAISLLVIVWLIQLGLFLSFSEKPNYLFDFTFYFGLFVLCLWVLAQLTNSAQLTPFLPIDKALYQWDGFLKIDLIPAVVWTNHYPNFKFLLLLAYSSLNYQIMSIPLLLLLNKKFDAFLKMLNLLLISSLIGFTFYYFFPSVGPATLLQLPIFMDAQFATGIKFYQIHHHQIATTMKGGLIAFPSFHVVWSLICQYCAKDIKPIFLFYLLIPINVLLCCSTFLLGWHYFIDLLGGAALFGLTLFLTKKPSKDTIKNHTFPVSIV